MNEMRIGIDFDNTIVCYDEVFHKAAVHQGLIPSSIPQSKGAVRDYLRSAGREEAWTELQGHVYGARMDLAFPYPDVERFFRLCNDNKIAVFIISHKTKFPFLGPKYNLHESARQWLVNQNFSWTPAAYFELTLADKLARISACECTHFIDDLPELLAEKNFPGHVQKILFDPHRLHLSEPYFRISSWHELSQHLFHNA